MNSIIISSLFLLSSVAFGQESDRLDTVVSNAYDDLVDSTNSHIEELVAPVETLSAPRELLFKKKRSYGPTYNSKKAPAVRPVYSKKVPAPVYAKKPPAPVYSQKRRYLGEDDEADARELLFKKKRSYRPTFSKKAPAVRPVYSKKAPLRPVVTKKAPASVYAKKAPAPVYSTKGRYLGEEEDEADARELLFKKKRSYGPTYSKIAPAVRPVYSKKVPAPVYAKKPPAPVYFQKRRYLGEEDEADARELLFKKKRSYRPTFSKKAPAVRPVYSKKAPLRPVVTKKAPAPVYGKKAPAPVYSQKERYLGEEDEADARELLFKKKRSYGHTYSKKAPAVRPVYSEKTPLRPIVTKKAPAPVYARYLGEEDEADASEFLFKKKRSHGPTYSKKALAVRPVYSKKAPAPVYAKKAPAPVYSKKGRYLGEEDEADARELLFKKKRSYGPTYSKKAPALRPANSKKAPARPVYTKKAPAPVYSKGRFY